MLRIKFLPLALVILLTACNGITHTGKVRAMVYPNHNEDLMNATNSVGVKKWEITGEETLRYKRMSMTINPVLNLGNDWPRGATTYGYTLGILEANLWLRHHVSESMAIVYRKQKYFLVSNKLNRPDNTVCNCTYGNSIGLEYSW